MLTKPCANKTILFSSRRTRENGQNGKKTTFPNETTWKWIFLLLVFLSHNNGSMKKELRVFFSFITGILIIIHLVLRIIYNNLRVLLFKFISFAADRCLNVLVANNGSIFRGSPFVLLLSSFSCSLYLLYRYTATNNQIQFVI